MESKEPITAESFFDEYFTKQCGTNFLNTLFAGKPSVWMEFHIMKANKEYAVLFARHHREKAVEAIYHNATCDWKGNLSYASIENAYPESNIQ